MDAAIMTHGQSTIAVTGLGPMCRYGQSHGVLGAALGWRGTLAAPEAAHESWFDPLLHLGKHGYKYHVKASQMLWAATRSALSDADLHSIDRKARVGVCIGTNFAVHETLRSFDRVIRSTGSAALQPMLAPNFSVNLPASVLSLKEGYQALNVTLTNPLVAGLESVIVGANAIVDGRADKIIAGSSEDHTCDCADQLGADGSEAAACALVLERAADAMARGAKVHALLSGYVQRFYGTSGRLLPAPDDFIGLLSGLALTRRAAAPAGSTITLSIADDSRPLARAAIQAFTAASKQLGLDVEVKKRAPLLARLGCAAALLHGIALLAREEPLVLVECSPYGHLVALALSVPRGAESKRAQ